MHEMSLAERIRAIVQDQAHTHDFTRLKALRPEIGRFAGVEQPALEFAVDVAMRGNPAERAKLEMIALPGRALRCDCMTTLDPAPHCDADLQADEANLRRFNPGFEVLCLSTPTGEGMAAWLDWLNTRLAENSA